MKRLDIGFGFGGYVVTFGLELFVIREIKENFPDAKPIKRVTVGYEDVTNTLEPYRDPISKYVLPLLTGLTEKQLSTINEIVIYSSMRDITLLKIVKPQSHQQPNFQSQPKLHVEQV